MWAGMWGGALLLLLLSGAVHGDLITTPEYSCDPATCQPPKCLCAANNIPGGLTADQIPQFVLIAHENALDALPYDLLISLIGNKTQSNGCPVPVTWFAMRYHSNCENGRMALARGDEVAMQANRFDPTDPFNATDPNPHYDSRDPVTGQPSVQREILMSREWWNQSCKLPLYNMVGFRAQGYYNNPPIRTTLMEGGYLYDSTLPERYYAGSPTSPSLSQMLWPYTMDGGIPQECGFFGPEVGKCAPGEKRPGLWEVPLYYLQDNDTLYGAQGYGDTTLDGVPPVANMTGLLVSQLDQHVAGARTPLSINTFYEWLSVKPATPPADDPRCIYCIRAPSPNGLALASFVDYALSKPEVRFITHSDLVRWMQNPVPLDRFDDWVQCKVPGVKADLSGVRLPAADKQGAFYLTAGSGAVAAAPAPAAQNPGAGTASGDSSAGAPSDAALQTGPLEQARSLGRRLK